MVTGSISQAGAGVAIALRELTRAMNSGGSFEVSVVSLRDTFSERDSHNWKPLEPELLLTRGPRFLSYAPKLTRRLKELSTDITHSHGIWQYPSAAVATWGRATGRPHVVSPHGMLDPWAWRNSRWKKRIALALYEGRHLRNAACLHALCNSEYESFRSFGLKNPVAVIPNGVTLPSCTVTQDHGPPRLVFLGRLHPKKGLRELIDAWAQIPANERGEWQLVIAGWDDGGHEPALRQQADERGVATSVEFVGPKFGLEKEQLLASATAFILPSFSEGLPMSVLEAWSYGLPVVMTGHCNLPEGFSNEAALRIKPDSNSIATGLRKIMELSPTDRAAMGIRGRALVEKQFTWPEIARQMAEVYEWVLGGGTRPDCVVLS